LWKEAGEKAELKSRNVLLVLRSHKSIGEAREEDQTNQPTNKKATPSSSSIPPPHPHPIPIPHLTTKFSLAEVYWRFDSCSYEVRGFRYRVM
jgi:hypothetical protein